MNELIEIKGKKYEVNVTRALALGVLTEHVLYRRGQKFHQPFGNSTYIIACPTENHAALIDLKNGCCWTDAIEVKDVNNISRKEWENMTLKDPDFTPITE